MGGEPRKCEWSNKDIKWGEVTRQCELIDSKFRREWEENLDEVIKQSKRSLATAKHNLKWLKLLIFV